MNTFSPRRTRGAPGSSSNGRCVVLPDTAVTSKPSLTPIGRLLKDWRSIRKLSQLDLALKAGVSQRHLSFVESGRSRPGRDTVMELSIALDLPLRERNDLLGAAGFAPLYETRSLDMPEMASVLKALEITLRHHEPYPAVVVDNQWNLVMQNKASQAMLSLIDDPDRLWQRTCGDGPRNVIRVTFHAQGLRPLIQNWDDVGRTLLHRLRREALAKPGGGIDGLIADLLADPDMPASWRSVDWRQTLSPMLPCRLSLGGLTISLFSMLSTFGTPQDVTVDELRVETFFPDDEATEQLMHQLAQSTC